MATIAFRVCSHVFNMITSEEIQYHHTLSNPSIEKGDKILFEVDEPDHIARTEGVISHLTKLVLNKDEKILTIIGFKLNKKKW